MPETAETLRPQPVEIKRFYIADLTTHGPWLMPRLLKLYPNQTERSIIGWLNTVIDQNEFLCLVTPNAACFAERVAFDRLSAKFIVREIFVWCRDAENALQQKEAAAFYPRMADWARHQGIDKLIVCERSDVPVVQVREQFGGKLHEFKTMFVRV